MVICLCGETFFIQGKACDDVLFESLGSPDAKLGALVGT